MFKASYELLFFVGVLVLFSSQPLWAESRYITCSSGDSEYNYCRVHTEDHVKLSRQLSKSACQEGRSWGYDRYGVWVDRGCRAEFVVGRSGHSEYNNGGYGDYDDHRERSRQEYEFNNKNYGNIPGWVVGRYNGKNTRDQTPVSITISQKGEVAATWGGVRHAGYFDGRNLRIGDMDFIVKQVPGGFETILRKDHGNRVVFQRAR